MKIRLEGDPFLEKACAPYEFGSKLMPDPITLARQLAESMWANKGLGLAAPQIGVGLRIFALLLSNGKAVTCFNPSVVTRYGGERRGEEGCLSYPGVFVQVRRAHGVEVRYQTSLGAWTDKVFEGQTARAFLHELDHLDGRTLKDLVPAQALALARSRRKTPA